MTPQIQFQLRKDGYALLSLDHLERVRNTKRAQTPTLVPPLRSPLADQSANGKQLTTGMSRTFYIFLEEMLRKTGSDLQSIQFLAPSIDEEDILFGGSGTLDATTNPVTFTPTVSGTSRFGTTFQPGDWFIWNHPGRYEIDRITAMRNNTWTVKRGEFDSLIGAQSGQFWRLEPRTFTVLVEDGELKKDVEQWPWANKCVAAVRSTAYGLHGAGPDYTVNFGKITANVPGWRTMNGAEYLVPASGTLTVGQRADYRVPVRSWTSIQSAFAELSTGTASSNITIAIIYIAPGDTEASRAVGLIDRVTIPSGKHFSFTTTDPPDKRQLPYGATFPPNLLPGCGTLGTLTTPVTLSGSAVLFQPDGEIDLVVETASDQNVLAVVQT